VVPFTANACPTECRRRGRIALVLVLGVLGVLAQSACTFLIDARDGRADASPSVDAPPGLIDSGAVPDALACSPVLSVNIVNPMNPGGTVDVATTFLEATCNDSDGTCYYCIEPGEQVSLTATAETGAVFTDWSTGCATLCVNGSLSNPCTFLMPSQDVGCLADFAPAP